MTARYITLTYYHYGETCIECAISETIASGEMKKRPRMPHLIMVKVRPYSFQNVIAWIHYGPTDRGIGASPSQPEMQFLYFETTGA